MALRKTSTPLVFPFFVFNKQTQLTNYRIEAINPPDVSDRYEKDDCISIVASRD